MYVKTPMMRNFAVHWPTWLPSFKMFLFKWIWILIGLQGFIEQFWQNNFAPKMRYGLQNTLRALFEHPINFGTPLVSHASKFHMRAKWETVHSPGQVGLTTGDSSFLMSVFLVLIYYYTR